MGYSGGRKREYDQLKVMNGMRLPEERWRDRGREAGTEREKARN